VARSGYGQLGDDDWTGYRTERAEILEFIRTHGITGFVSLAGDRHAFQAGVLSRSLPPDEFVPVAVEFVTGSISAPGLFAAAEYAVPREHPLRPLYQYDALNGSVRPAINVTLMHGVRASIELQRTHDPQAALAVASPTSRHTSRSWTPVATATPSCARRPMYSRWSSLPSRGRWNGSMRRMAARSRTASRTESRSGTDQPTHASSAHASRMSCRSCCDCSDRAASPKANAVRLLGSGDVDGSTPRSKRCSTPFVEAGRVVCCGKVAKVGDRDGGAIHDRRWASPHVGNRGVATSRDAQLTEYVSG
jgi:hypothetical protein